MDPAVSVIILNYNGRRWIAGCLSALAAQRAAPAFEIVFVDNGSRDGSVELVRSEWPHARVVETGGNLGFAAGNNAGAAAARAPRLVFLNNDTEPEPDWLANLAAEASAHADFALTTSCVVFLDDPSRVDSAGDGYFLAGGAFKRGYGAASGAFAESREVFGACGAAFTILAADFAALGGFDPRFFMNFEDVDLSYRARLRGWKVWYAASAVVRHAGSGSLGVASPAAVYYGQRNLEWAWIKNTPPDLLWKTAAAHAVYSLAGLAHYARAGRGWAALRGKIAALAGLPAMLRERRRIQSARAVDPDALARLMEPRWLAVKRGEKHFAAQRSESRIADRSSLNPESLNPGSLNPGSSNRGSKDRDDQGSKDRDDQGSKD